LSPRFRAWQSTGFSARHSTGFSTRSFARFLARETTRLRAWHSTGFRSWRSTWERSAELGHRLQIAVIPRSSIPYSVGNPTVKCLLENHEGEGEYQCYNIACRGQANDCHPNVTNEVVPVCICRAAVERPDSEVGVFHAELQVVDVLNSYTLNFRIMSYASDGTSKVFIISVDSVESEPPSR
jgi:hypothetical protein